MFESDAKSFAAKYKEWTGQHLTNDNLPLQARPQHQIVVDIEPLVTAVQRRLLGSFEELTSMADKHVSVEMCRSLARNAIDLERDVRELLRHPFIQRYFPVLARPQGEIQKPRKTMSIPSSCLLKVPVCMYVTGPPGTGKTTLLRRITQLTAQDKSAPIPVFLPLLRLTDFTRRGLIKACTAAMAEQGFDADTRERSKHNFAAMCRTGRIRLCLDGLDETGIHAVRVMTAVNQLSEEFPKLQIILSCRDSFTKVRQEEALAYWDRALTIRLLPFSERQLEQFLGKWFSAEPSSRAGLMQWFRNNPRMKQAGTTPLIAALLCSLFQIKAEMPRTELDLYSRRLELLLGRWERAKGVQRLPAEVRTRYELFLKELAFTMHCRETRTFSHAQALAMVAKYSVKTFHKTNLAMLQDCIQRGVLEVDENGQLSFGHLTYQEHLCAEWMAYHNLVEHIASIVTNPWWSKTCEFYAAQKLDITPLVKAVKKSGNKLALTRLAELMQFAPLTSKNAL